MIMLKLAAYVTITFLGLDGKEVKLYQPIPDASLCFEAIENLDAFADAFPEAAIECHKTSIITASPYPKPKPINP
mgnify:CR=1 FL=1